MNNGDNIMPSEEINRNEDGTISAPQNTENTTI
jgi:hypothetical protein